MKSLPLYVGALLMAAAIAGAVVSVMDTGSSPESVAPPPPPPTVSTPVADELSPDQVKAQDEADIMEILLEQVEATPANIDPGWLQSFCVNVSSREDLKQFWDTVVDEGRKYDAQYTALHEQDRVVLSRNPLYYVFEAREFIHTLEPRAKKLRRQARGLLQMAIYKSWQESLEEAREALAKEQRRKPEDVEVPEEMGSIDDEVKTSFFKENMRRLELLAEIAVAEGGNPRQYTPDRVHLLEAAIVDRFLSAQDLTVEARERYRQTSASSRPATVAIARASRAVDENLLSLGTLYVAEALAEKTFRNRQQDYALRGFQALAMVYQRSHSGAALAVMRKSNRIQRYNLWQMARVAWQNAKRAVEAGDKEEADDQFFHAKQRYLQCLSRLESSKKPIILDEYKRMQADINAWMATRGAAAVAAAGG